MYGLNSKTIDHSVLLLEQLLADEFTLFLKHFKFHWNVKGPFFGPLHSLFEKWYKESFEIVDEIAERIQQLGKVAPGTMKEFMALAGIQERPQDNPKAEKMIEELLADHELIIKNIRIYIDATDRDFREMGSSDFFLKLIQTHEKYAWILRSHLE